MYKILAVKIGCM